VSISDDWREFVGAIDLPEEVATALVDPERLDEAIDAVAVDDPTLARYIHAVTHLTVSPNLARGGNKTNIVPDGAYAEVDIRTLPGMDRDFVNDHLLRAAGPAADLLALTPIADHPASVSSRDNPLWDAIVAGIETHTGSAAVLPTMMTGFTDARFWRARGTIAYGVGLHDDAIGFGEFLSLFHGNNERISVRSVDLTTELLTSVLAGFAARTVM
jgi:acetylornithine deacetylase/succinyl-diaminopimelate desuccinylase-like protein